MKLFLPLLLVGAFALSPAATAGNKKNSNAGAGGKKAAAGKGAAILGGGGGGMGHQGNGMRQGNFGRQNNFAHPSKGNALRQNNNLRQGNLSNPGKHGQLSRTGMHQHNAFAVKGNRQLGLHHQALHTHLGLNNHLHGGFRGHFGARRYSLVVRNYHIAYHERFWWRTHYNRIVLVGGGWYYWDTGYWYPAWGYDPGVAFYAYDGPIYSYDNLPPDQVILNIQSELQFQGYYSGPVDGQLGELTRAAIADYQRDHDLEITSAADEPTVNALGLV